MKAKCSDQPRFWAKYQPKTDYRNEGYLIFDRDRADRHMATMAFNTHGNLLCSFHGAEYWGIPTHYWRAAVDQCICDREGFDYIVGAA